MTSSELGEEELVGRLVEEGTAKGDGLLLAQVYAKTEGAVGALLIDIRREGGVGGSLRTARASVSQETGVTHSHITMPVKKREEYKVYIVPEGSAPEPGYSVHKYYP